MLRRQLAIAGFISLPFVIFVWSFGSFVLVDNGDTMQQRAVTWGRDHHLGALIDSVERKQYSSPPSRQAADHLAVLAAGPMGLGVPVTTAKPVGGVALGPSALGPAPLAPVVKLPLPGEGVWQVIDSAGGAPAVWALSIPPSSAHPS